MRILLLTVAMLAALPRPFQAQQLTARDSALHVLNRLAFGPRPGDVDAVAREGVLHWIDRQLEASPSRSDALTRLEGQFEILRQSTKDLERDYRAHRLARRQAKSDTVRMAPPSDITRGRRRGAELQQLAAVRMALGEPQLREVLFDFWSNHFNVFYRKNLDRVYLPGYLEETIRPRVLGRFEDLLLATARSPAMLIYLDNASSVAVGPRPPTRRGAGAARRPTGLNENYARELLELHTLGVDGGYTQADVVNVARIFTGWSIDREQGEFRFNDWAHDRGTKMVLSVPFTNGGESEGKRLLEWLANHPATRHHVSAKLCARLVSDAVPDGCVDDAVAAWRKTGGSIAAVVRAIVSSADFWASANRLAKVKTPLEFVVSATRALGGTPAATPQLAQAIASLGQPLFLESAPTGYPETQADWVNSAALLNRMSFAVALANGRVAGVAIDLDRVAPATTDRRRLLDAIDQNLLGGQMTRQTRAVIERTLADEPDPGRLRALAIGLALGGPEFQRQ